MKGWRAYRAALLRPDRARGRTRHMHPLSGSQNSSTVVNMICSIADYNSDTAALAAFFLSNLTPEYISHSELQGYRAVQPRQWSENIGSVLRDEIGQRLSEPLARFPSKGDWKGCVQAHNDSCIVGFALVSICRFAEVPFGTIEDIAIDAAQRGRGIGWTMIQWIIDNFSGAGIKRIFLESGIENESAHRLFKRVGFEPVSLVMMHDINDR
jgi:ribosomal protein S18 acetylase RimI-like enzyme